METVDYKSHLRKFYRPISEEVELVDVPRLNFLMVDGSGDPDSAPYGEAVDALFALAETLRIMIKKGKPSIDYGLMPLEALWWSAEPSRFSPDRKALWNWTLMIMQPEIITRKIFLEGQAQTKAGKAAEVLARIRLEAFAEGRAAQKLHVGPPGGEGPAIARIHARIQAIGADFAGKHHEINLSDVRKAVPEKRRILLRQPYR